MCVHDMKEIKKENGYEINFNGRFSGELDWEIVQQFTSEEPMNYFEELSNKFASEGSPIYLPKLDSMFSRTKTFCFEKDVFLTFGLGMHEGVSEGSRSGKRVSRILHPYHVDIQVGSCICLNVFMLNHCMCT